MSEAHALPCMHCQLLPDGMMDETLVFMAAYHQTNGVKDSNATLSINGLTIPADMDKANPQMKFSALQRLRVRTFAGTTGALHRYPIN